jgi:spermidine synthase
VPERLPTRLHSTVLILQPLTFALTKLEERLVEYPIEELVYEEQSQYQTIQIFQTTDFGR